MFFPVRYSVCIFFWLYFSYKFNTSCKLDLNFGLYRRYMIIEWYIKTHTEKS